MVIRKILAHVLYDHHWRLVLIKNRDVPFKEGLQMGECGGSQLKGKGGLRSHTCVELMVKAIASELGKPDQNPPQGSATPWGVHPALLLSPNVFSIPFYLQSLPYKASKIFKIHLENPFLLDDLRKQPLFIITLCRDVIKGWSMKGAVHALKTEKRIISITSHPSAYELFLLHF